MANMQLLSRLGVAPLAMKRLVSPAALLSWQSVSCNLNKFHSHPKHHQILQVKEVESFRRLETHHVCGTQHPINSPWSEEDTRKLTSQDGTQVTAHQWEARHFQNVALFGHRGHDLLTRLKICLVPLSQQLMPVRHYVVKRPYVPKSEYPIPDKLEPWLHFDETYGITFTSYLSEQNVEMLRVLAQPEFNSFSMFNYGRKVIQLIDENPTRKYPEKISEDKLFGLPLDLLMKKDTEFKKNAPHLNIPSLLCLMLKYIHKNGSATKGIFKTPDSSTKVKKLKEDIEANFYKNKNYEISKEYNAHDVAAALKDFIAQLQKPLLTTPVLQFFPDFFRRERPLFRMLEGLNYYILMMTPEHRDSLQLFLEVLHALTKNSAQNGLTVQDCGDIFWPVLFSLPPNCPEAETATRKKQFVDLTRVLVHYNEYLFTVPTILLNKLRRLHKTGEQPKTTYNEELEYRQRMDMVHFVTLHLTSPESKDEIKKIVLDSSTTAEEVVKLATGQEVPQERLMENLKCSILGKQSKTTNFLFESGGNLGYSEERALDPKTKVQLLWRENSSLSFVIKTWKGYNEEMTVKIVGNIKGEKPVYDVPQENSTEKEDARA